MGVKKEEIEYASAIQMQGDPSRPEKALAILPEMSKIIKIKISL